MTIRRLNAMALLTGLSLVLFVIEMQVPPPLPLPGVRIGLANVVTVYAVFRFRPGEALMILLARIFLAAVFAGQAASLLYSLAGGLLCLAGMLCLKRLLSLSRLWLCSLIGAVLHNTGQLAAAVLLLGTSSVLAYFPVLALTGAAAGLFTGILAQNMLRRGPIHHIFSETLRP